MHSPQTGAYCKLAKCFMHIHFAQLLSPCLYNRPMTCMHMCQPIHLSTGMLLQCHTVPVGTSFLLQRLRWPAVKSFTSARHVDEDGSRARVGNSILDLTELEDTATLKVSISEGFCFSTSDQLQKCQ